MCLAVPSRIVSVSGLQAEVDIDGVRRKTSLYLVPEAKVGDYVLLHAGFAIKILDEDEARETLDLLRQFDVRNA